MLRLLVITTLVSLAGCPGDEGSTPAPDAAVVPARPDAAVDAPPPPPDARLRAYGESCTSATDCLSGLCVGSQDTPYICSRACSLDVAMACKDVDAFCVPIGGGDNACYGSIETGSDLDDAIVQTGDSVQRSLTPLGDADLFLVRLNQVGTTTFRATPQPSIDIKLEAYGMIGAPLGISNDVGPGSAELMETSVQQLGAHVFLVVRNIGTSTGGYTFAVTTGATAASSGAPAIRRLVLERAP